MLLLLKGDVFLIWLLLFSFKWLIAMDGLNDGNLLLLDNLRFHIFLGAHGCVLRHVKDGFELELVLNQ